MPTLPVNRRFTIEMIEDAIDKGEVIFDVALSFAGEDRDFVADVVEHLTQEQLTVFYDKYEPIQTYLWGKDLGDALDQVYRRLSKYVVIFISRDYKDKMWTNHERKSALSRAVQERREYVLPARFDDTELDGLRPSVSYIDLRDETPETFAARIANKVSSFFTKGTYPKTRQPIPEPSRIAGKQPRLFERVKDEHWQIFEHAAIHAVTAGGMAAMGYYRQALQWPPGMAKQSAEEKNPSTIADLQATSAILQTIDSYLSPVARRLGSPLLFLGEETGYQEWLEKNLSQNVFQRIQSPDDFFIEEENSIRVILDGVDGTGNFVRGMPLFCSAVAIILGNQVRVSAIYDPIHHLVYSALLSGPYHSPSAQKRALSWQISTGSRIDLTQLAREAEQSRLELKKEAIGVHLTRSNPQKLHEFLSSRSPSAPSILQRLAEASGAIYAINSGTVAMADIAKGALGGFVNNVTHLWDVAAGEVLVRACRGEVTDFEGSPIDYSHAHQVSVVAAKEHLHSRIIEILRD